MSDDAIPTGADAGAISTIDKEELLARSVEVVRMWVENGGGGTFIIKPDRLESPEMFGMMLADCARHAAVAYAHELGITQSAAMDAIWEGLDEERDDPSGEPETIQTSGRTH